MAQAHHQGEYPDDWKQIADEVKADADGCCIRCGHPHDPPAGYTLTVHHFNGDKSVCERWNLMPLCQRCHLSVQARVDPEQPLMFMPSSWCLPYIAGFYESGRGVPGPLYDITIWAAMYTRDVGPWPAWAPVAQEVTSA